MSLREELEGKRVAQICSVRKLLESLPADVAQELRELIEDYTVQLTQLAALSKKRGWNVGESSFGRHRRKICKCSEMN